MSAKSANLTPCSRAAPTLITRYRGLQDYAPIWREMQAFTATRQRTTADELWLLQHLPIYTLGQAGQSEHVLRPGNIPVLAVDRGGQVTYHGPGQLIAYVLLDLRRLGLGVRQLVTHLEQSVIALLQEYGIAGTVRREAPGVYVAGSKIAALGLRVRHGCCYHGLSLNVALDLTPFTRINPCGYPGLGVTELSALGGPKQLESVAQALETQLRRQLGYDPSRTVH